MVMKVVIPATISVLTVVLFSFRRKVLSKNPVSKLVVDTPIPPNLLHNSKYIVN